MVIQFLHREIHQAFPTQCAQTLALPPKPASPPLPGQRMLIFPVAQARSLVILECCLSYILISTPSASFVGSNSKTLPESPQCPHPGLSVTSHLNYQNSLPGSLTLPPVCPQRQSQGSTSSSPPTHAHRKQVALSPARVTSAIAASLFPHCSSGPLWKQSPLPDPFQPPAYHGPFR